MNSYIHNKLTLLYLIFSINIFAQSGEVLYDAEMMIGNLTNIKKAKISNEAKSLLINSFKNQVKPKYILKFNKNESYFKKVETLKVDTKKIDLAEIQIGKGVYYVRKSDKKILNQKEFSDELFLIDIPEFSWRLSQETKKIGNYICFKATTTKEIDTRRGKALKKITAWYSPKLPYNYGPKDYNGLPGLILELQEDSLLLKVSKISLFPDEEKNIKKPNKGKKVTLKEYDSIVKKIVKNHWRYRQ